MTPLGWLLTRAWNSLSISRPDVPMTVVLVLPIIHRGMHTQAVPLLGRPVGGYRQDKWRERADSERRRVNIASIMTAILLAAYTNRSQYSCAGLPDSGGRSRSC